jgi:putative ubiquitin-RnfH superfamily antitoxin RatB of RatAB toxin-antitoxin module
MRIIVAYSPAPRQMMECVLDLPKGATARQALQASGWLASRPELARGAIDVGVWGRSATPTQVLEEGDRVEIYRPLRVDPKVARRERFQKQGVRSAGLFAQRRPGAKPGY